MSWASVTVLLFLFCMVISTNLPAPCEGQSGSFRFWFLFATVITMIGRPPLCFSHFSSALQISTPLIGKLIRYICKYQLANQLSGKQHAKQWRRAFIVFAYLKSVWELGGCPLIKRPLDFIIGPPGIVSRIHKSIFVFLPLCLHPILPLGRPWSPFILEGARSKRLHLSLEMSVYQHLEFEIILDK